MVVEPRLDAWLAALRELSGSDLLLCDGRPPLARFGDGLIPISGAEPLSGEEIEAIVRAQIDDHYGERVHRGREVDFTFNWREQERIRASAFYQRGRCSLALRRRPLRVPQLADLGLPAVLADLLFGHPGVLLVAGQTGSGKSTTLAALVDLLNRHDACHIVTVEDPIEYEHSNLLATVSQREVGTDTASFATAMRSLRREMPDVVVIDEVYDAESIGAALELADSGRRVIAAMGVNDSVRCLERVIQVFTGARRPQAQAQLAGGLLGVLYQRLLRGVDGRPVAAHELIVGVPAVRGLVRDGNLGQLRQLVTSGEGAWVCTLEQSLSALVAVGALDLSSAVNASLYPQEIDPDLASQLAQKGAATPAATG